jgi:YD repeat-containing protein
MRPLFWSSTRTTVHHCLPGRRPHRHHPALRRHGDLVLHQCPRADRQETKQTDPDTGTTTFDKYDDLGNRLQATDARGQILSYAYDNLDRKPAEYSGAWSATPDPSKELASFSYDTLATGCPTSSTRYAGRTVAGG